MPYKTLIFGVVCQRLSCIKRRMNVAKHLRFTHFGFAGFIWSTLPPPCICSVAIVSLTSIVFLIDCIFSLETPDVYEVVAVTITQHTQHTRRLALAAGELVSRCVFFCSAGTPVARRCGGGSS